MLGNGVEHSKIKAFGALGGFPPGALLRAGEDSGKMLEKILAGKQEIVRKAHGFANV